MTSSGNKNGEMLKIAHLSDIHFYEANDTHETNHRHDVECLRGIERLIEENQPDVLLVTGDITNIGDKLSCDRVYQWIHDRIYVDGDYLGLQASKTGMLTIIVPGNHDAFNAPSHGANYKRWQSSLGNFYSAFREYKFENEDSVDYTFLRKGDTRVFICRVDSCFLGDGDAVARSGSISLDRIARGKLSKNQSRAILEIYDRGLQGRLIDSREEVIPSAEFLGAMKILVMHHYLFEPADTKGEALLQVDDRSSVFQNIAMSDFDALVCGHKHVADIQLLVYSDHFDPRARIRLAVNHVRRCLGISSLPIQSDSNGRLWSRMYRLLLTVMYLNRPEKSKDDLAEEIISILQSGLTDPSALRKELSRKLRERGEASFGGLIDYEELQDLHQRITAAFSKNQQKQLVRAAVSLKGMIQKLAGRPFAQITSASSAKASEQRTKNRAVSFYNVGNDKASEEYTIVAKRFSWFNGSFCQPISLTLSFPYSRVANADS